MATPILVILFQHRAIRTLSDWRRRWEATGLEADIQLTLVRARTRARLAKLMGSSAAATRLYRLQKRAAA